MNAKNTKKANDLMAQLQELLDADKQDTLTEAEKDDEKNDENEEEDTEEVENTEEVEDTDDDTLDELPADDDFVNNDSIDNNLVDDVANDINTDTIDTTDTVIDNMTDTSLESRDVNTYVDNVILTFKNQVRDIDDMIVNLETDDNNAGLVSVLTKIKDDLNTNIGRAQAITNSNNEDANNIIKGQEEAKDILLDNGAVEHSNDFEEVSDDIEPTDVETADDLNADEPKTQEAIKPLSDETETETETEDESNEDEDKNESLNKVVGKKLAESYADVGAVDLCQLNDYTPSKEAAPYWNAILNSGFSNDEIEKIMDEFVGAVDYVSDEELDSEIINNWDMLKDIFNIDKDPTFNESCNKKVCEDIQGPRYYTNKIIDYLESIDGLNDIVESLLNWLSEDDVKEWAELNLDFDFEEEDSEDDDDFANEDINEAKLRRGVNHKMRECGDKFKKYNTSIFADDIADDEINEELPNEMQNNSLKYDDDFVDLEGDFSDDIELTEDLDDIPYDIIEDDDIPDIGDDKEDILVKVAHGNYDPDDYTEEANDSKSFPAQGGPTLTDI